MRGLTGQPAKSDYSWHFEHPDCIIRLRDAYLALAQQLNPGLVRKTIVLCIGTDRSTGDSLGPLVGSRLNRYSLPEIAIYGTLDQPVHAANLVETLASIQERYSHPFIVAIDASLGRIDRIGYITIKPGKLYPGTALKKELPPVGELHISGVVNVAGFLEHLVLQNTRLNTVCKIANTIATGLWLAQRSLVTNTRDKSNIQPSIN